jgi:hypothetical protein
MFNRERQAKIRPIWKKFALCLALEKPNSVSKMIQSNLFIRNNTQKKDMHGFLL